MRTADVRPIGPRHQVTLPSEIMKVLNLHAGDMVKFTLRNKALLMSPVEVLEKEDTLSRADIRALEKMLLKQIRTGQYVTFPGNEAVEYLHKRMKK